MERHSAGKTHVLSPMDGLRHEVETTMLDPTVDGDDFRKALELAQRASVSRDPKWAQSEGITVHQNPYLQKYARHAYVLDPGLGCEGSEHEGLNPYMVKRYRSPKEAGIQAGTLNALGGVLEGYDSTVTTARVVALTGDGCSPPACVMERAPGQSLRSRYEPAVVPYGDPHLWFQQLMQQLTMLRGEMDEILGPITSRLLLNDIDRHGNAGANVFCHLDEAGQERLTIIDQPYVGVVSGLWRAAMWNMVARHEGITGLLDNMARVR